MERYNGIKCESLYCKFVIYSMVSGWVCGAEQILLNNKRQCTTYEKGDKRDWKKRGRIF